MLGRKTDCHMRSNAPESSCSRTLVRPAANPSVSSDWSTFTTARAASDAEIKRAFRTLARELHPDVSSAPDAGSRFRDVAEAFEVLSDPARRATYDRYGKAGLRRGGFQ